MRLAYDAGCYLCPGNLRANGERNPAYKTTFAFDNDFPALLPESAAPASGGGELLVSEPAAGRCRVLVLLAAPRRDARRDGDGCDPRRGGRVGERDRDARGAAGDPLRPGVREQGRHDGLQQPASRTARSGPRATCRSRRRASSPRSAPGSRGTAAISSATTSRRSCAGASASCAATSSWVALVPYWAVWPFELMLVPVRRVPDLPALTGDERDAPRGPAAPGGRPLRQPVPHLVSRTRSASTAARRTARSTPSGGCTPPTTLPCCARRRCGSSWSASSSRPSRSATSPPRTRRRGSASWARPTTGRHERHRSRARATCGRPLPRELPRRGAAPGRRPGPRQPDRRAHRLQRRLRAADGDRARGAWSRSGPRDDGVLRAHSIAYRRDQGGRDSARSRRPAARTGSRTSRASSGPSRRRGCRSAAWTSWWTATCRSAPGLSSSAALEMATARALCRGHGHAMGGRRGWRSSASGRRTPTWA